MIVTAHPRDAREWTVATTATKRVAFVPTMGALHEGHLSLVRRGMELADEVAVSIFVNPTQFGPQEDLAKYPRPIEEDLAALKAAGVAMVFHPPAHVMYPPGFSTFVEPPAVAGQWEGNIRPGHFRGVCTVVLKLFQIIPATFAVFGQKDYQQVSVIRAMVADLELPITLDVLPTVREPDGLALSSRNRYLSEGQRKRAGKLSQALFRVRHLFAAGERDAKQLEIAMATILQPGGDDGVDSIDYAVVADCNSLARLDTIQHEAVALIAARVGTTRLIDNILLTADENAGCDGSLRA